MPDLKKISLKDLQHAAFVAEHVAEHTGNLPGFRRLASLLRQYAEFCEMYMELSPAERRLLELGAVAVHEEGRS